MKYLLTTLCAAAFAMPLTIAAPQAPSTDAIPHCGKCGKKCKDGCECEKCKKKKDEAEKEGETA